jgi:biotin carboxylase
MKSLNDSYVWVLGGGTLQVPNILCAKELGYKTIITDKNKDCICRKKTDLFFPVDIFDIEKNVSLLNKLKKKYHIKSIFVGGIDCTVTQATLAKKLSLVSSGVKIAKLTNNKFSFRKFLKKNKIINIPFIKVAKLKKNLINKIERKIGYPFIVKNVDNSASRGIEIIKKKISTQQLDTYITKAIEVSRCGYCIIEKYFYGKEYTVETLFDINGKFYPCFITDRYFNHESGKAIELGLRNPSKLKLSLQKKIFSFAERIAKKVGVKVGPAKFDLMISNNRLIVIEMTTRLSGGFDCQYLVPAATGKDVIKAAMLTSLGEEFDPKLLKNKFNRVALSRSVWPKPGKIKKIIYKKNRLKKNEYLKVFFTKKINDIISNYENCADRPCFIIAASQDEKKANNLINRAKKNIIINTI